MQVVDFFNLERSLQDRFVEAASGSVPPTPLAFTPARPRPAVFAWWGACVLGIVAVGLVLALGFGSLDSSLAILGTPWAIALGALVAFAVFAALRALALDHDRDSLPYRAGAYVFPIGVVDAQTAVVRVYRFPDLKDVSRRERRVSLLFDGGVRFEFETADPALADQLVSLVEQNRQRVSGDSGPPSSRELAALDPLADTGFKSPFTPSEPRRKSSPRWLRFGWLEAVIAGAVLGPLAWKARNFVSEERLYTAARNLGTTAAFRAYLERGGHRPDVPEILLPHAELQEAIAKGSVAALEAFMARGKHPKIENEVQAALKKALLAELSAPEPESAAAPVEGAAAPPKADAAPGAEPEENAETDDTSALEAPAAKPTKLSPPSQVPLLLLVAAFAIAIFALCGAKRAVIWLVFLLPTLLVRRILRGALDVSTGTRA